MASYKNNIKLGVSLAPLNEVKKQLNDIIKQLENNNKLNLKLHIDSSNLGFKDLTKAIDNMSKRFEELNKRSKEFTNSTKENSNAFKNAENSASSFSSSLKSAFASVGIYVGTYEAIRKTVDVIKDASQYVVQLDSALVGLKKVTNETDDTYKAFLETAHNVSLELGTQADKFTEAVESWAKTGKSLSESTELAKNTMLLTKVGDVGNVDTAQTYLLPALQAFNIEAEKSIGLVNEFNNLSNNMATDVHKMGEALARSASSLGVAGNSLEESLALIATATQNTQLSGETIGNALKTISLRIAEFKDEDGELIPNFEEQLSSLGVTMRDSQGQILSTYDILNQVAQKYGEMDKNTQLMISQLIGGKLQSNVVSSILSDVGELNRAYDLANNSAGSAIQEFETYQQSIQYSIDQLKENINHLYTEMVNSNALKSFINGLSEAVKWLDSLDGETVLFYGSVASLMVILTKLSKLNKEAMALTALEGSATTLKEIIAICNKSGVVTGLGSAFGLLSASIKGATTSSLAFIATPVGAVITSIGIAIAGATVAFNNYKKHQEEVQQQTDNLKTSIKNLNTTLGEGNTKGVDDDLNNLEKHQEELKKYIKLLEETKEKSEYSFNPTAGGISKNDIISSMYKKVEEYKKEITDAGMTVDEFGNIVELTNSKCIKSNLELIDSIEKQTEEQLNNRSNLEEAQAEYDNYVSIIQNLYSEYQNLSSQESLNSEEKDRLGTVVSDLKSKFDDLNIGIDENGKAYIENTPLIEEQISYLTSEGMTTETLTGIRITDAKVNSEWQVGNSNVTYAEIQKRIEMYKAEIQAIQQVIQARVTGAMGEVGSATYEHMSIAKAQSIEANSPEYQEYLKNAEQLRAYEEAKKKIDSLYDGMGSINVPQGGGSYSVPTYSGLGSEGSSGSKVGSGGSSGSSGKSDAEKAQEEAEKYAEKIADLTAEIDVDKYYELNNAISEIDNALDLNKTLQEDVYGDKALGLKQEELQLMKKKQTALETLNNQQKQELMTERKILEEKGFLFNADGNIINQQEKLQELADKINNQTYENTEDGVEQKQNEIDSLKELQEELKNYTDLNTSKIPSVTKQWRELNNEIKSGILSTLQDTIDKEKEMYELQLENKQNSDTKALENYKTEQEKLHNQRLDDLNEELDALEENNEEEERENTLLEKKNALKQAEIDLERVKNQKTVYSYKKQEDGTYQFSWEADKEAIQSAQETYDSAKKDLQDTKDQYELEDEKKDIQDQIDEENELYEAKQKEIEDYETTLSESYERQKKLLDYYYEDTDRLASESLDKLVSTYGDNFEAISTIVNTKLDETKTKLDELNKANIGYDLETVNKALSSDNIYEYVTNIQEQTDEGVSINLEGLKQKVADIEEQNGNVETEYKTHYTTVLTTQTDYQTDSRNSQETYQQEYLDSFILFSAQYVTLYDKMMQLIKMITDSGTNDITTMVQGAGEQVLNELVECKKAYDRFREMWNYMNPDDTIPSVDISSVVSDFNKYKQSVTDWQKSKEELFYASNNPLYNQDKYDKYVQLNQVGMTNFNALASIAKNAKGSTTYKIDVSNVSLPNVKSGEDFINQMFTYAQQKTNTNK